MQPFIMVPGRRQGFKDFVVVCFVLMAIRNVFILRFVNQESINEVNIEIKSVYVGSGKVPVCRQSSNRCLSSLMGESGLRHSPQQSAITVVAV